MTWLRHGLADEAVEARTPSAMPGGTSGGTGHAAPRTLIAPADDRAGDRPRNGTVNKSRPALDRPPPAAEPGPGPCRRPPGASRSRSRITTAYRRRKPAPSRIRPAPATACSEPGTSTAATATRPGSPSGNSTFKCGTPSTCRNAYARSRRPCSGCVTAVTTTSHGSKARKRRSLSPSWSRTTSPACLMPWMPFPGPRSRSSR